MADWSLPSLSSTYVLYRQYFNDRLVDAALMFRSDICVVTNIATGTIRWNASLSTWQDWSGAEWSALADAYAINITGNAATATIADSVEEGGVTAEALGTSSVTTNAIASKAVTLTKLADMSGQYRILGRVSSGPGSPEDITMQQVFGAVGGTTTGSLIVKNASFWAGIAPGSYGQYLKLPLSGPKIPYWGSLSVGPSNISGSAVNNYHVEPGTIPQRARSLVVDATDTNAFSTVVTSNGLGILSCGTNTNGQLGCGSTTNMDTWVCGAFNTPPGGVPIKKVVRAYNSVWVLFSNGNVYSCGINTYGQLGHGDQIQRNIFTRIGYFVTNGILISDIFVCASRYGSQDSVYFLASDGRLFSCGYNGYGQLGVGDSLMKMLPTQISGAISNISKIAAGGNSAFLLTSTGLVYACGYNGYGQLGVGDLSKREAFTAISGGITDVAEVYAWDGRSDGTNWGLSQSTFLLTNGGDVYATGYNGYGQLGLGDATQRTAFTHLTFPYPIMKLANFGGGSHPSMFAQDSQGDCYAWGYNANGTIGDGTTANRSTPWKIVGYSEDTAATTMPWNSAGGILQILEMGSALGHCAGVILDASSNLWGVGRANEGQLGLGSGLANVTRWTRIPSPTMWSSYELDRIVQVGRFGGDSQIGFMAITNSGLGGVNTGAGRVYATGYNGQGQTGTLSVRTASTLYTLQPCLLP